jgi:hypothetical protein
MKNYSENSLDDGHISYCKETDKHYKFNSNNQSDPTAGNNRPDMPVVGYQYFDTTINKPIFYDGSKWIDATGATV